MTLIFMTDSHFLNLRDMKEKQQHGGARPNAGRPKSKRELKRATFWMYEDQLPLTSKEVRAVVDQFLNNEKFKY